MRRRFINNHKTFDYSKYMTIEALEDGHEVYFSRDVEYNLNGHKWVPLKAGLTSPTLKKGDLLSLRCSLSPNECFGCFFSNDKAINLRGNILSLIFKDDINLDISGYDTVFYRTFSFYEGNNIVSVEKNFLPATTLAKNCYGYMFEGCKNLTTAPELPARTLANSCYSNMFYDCSKLNYIKMLATEATAQNCLWQWVQGVASTGTFVKNPAMNSLSTGHSGIPSGWTVVNDGEESGDGKTINYIRMSYEQVGSNEYVAIFNADYDVTSDIKFSIDDNRAGLYTDDFNASYCEMSGIIGVPTLERLTYSPKEDDTYIYEVIMV